MLSKKDLIEALSLSCVENYYLAWLKQYFDTSILYGQHFRSVKEIMSDFINGAIYENYYQIPKMQDVAEELGITEHHFYKCDFKEAISIITNNNSNKLCLIRVNSQFFKNFKMVPWREDHYILIDSNLNWLNQYPLSSGTFTNGDLEQCFDGTIIIYKLNNLNIDLKENIKSKIANQDIENIQIPFTSNSFLDAVGILRITRKRLLEFFKDNLELFNILYLEVKYLDKIYLQIRLLNLKNEKEINYLDYLNTILFYEKKIIEVLKNE